MNQVRQRYDMEHLFRFGKQKLLMTAYSTPDVEHEENWFKLTLELLGIKQKKWLKPLSVKVYSVFNI